METGQKEATGGGDALSGAVVSCLVQRPVSEGISLPLKILARPPMETTAR